MRRQHLVAALREVRRCRRPGRAPRTGISRSPCGPTSRHARAQGDQHRHGVGGVHGPAARARRAPPSRCRPRTSGRSRSRAATPSSGRSSCSACRGRRCRRSCPCCAAAGVLIDRDRRVRAPAGAPRTARVALERAQRLGRAEASTPVAVARRRPRSSGDAPRADDHVVGRLVAALHVGVEIGAAGDELAAGPSPARICDGLGGRRRARW